MSHSRKAMIGAASAALLLAMSACGSSSSTASDTTSGSASGGATTPALAKGCQKPDPGNLTPVTLQLQWNNQAQFAGYYAADAECFYQDAGLKVTLLEGGSDVVPQQVLEQGKADYAVSWAPKVLGDIDQGQKLTDIAQIFQRSGQLLVSLKSKNITTPADMAGKKWVNWGYGNQWEYLAMLQVAGKIPPAQTKYDAEGDAPTNLFQDGYDAVSAADYNEYAQLLETVNPDTGQLYQPSDFNVLNPNDYGVAMLEDGIWTMTDKLSNPAFKATTQKFVTASLEGWIWTRDHAEEAAQLTTLYGSTLPAGHQLWMANAVNQLIWPSPQGIGEVNQKTWQTTVSESEKVIDPATGKPLITKAPPASTVDMEFVDTALKQLKAEGLDVDGTNYKPLTVTLKAGGE